jgi:hypothetical protein
MKMIKTIFIALISVLMLSSCGEREGTVSTNGCREQIYIKEKSFEAATKKFTCTYYRTNQGRIMGGFCVHIEYDNNGQCKAAYTYSKSQDDVCPAKHNLGRDDMCYPN